MSTDDSAPPKPKPKPADDVLFVVGASEHGHAVVRKRSEAIELGELRTAPEGKPVHGELVKLTPREDGGGRLFNVETLAAKPAVAAKAAKHGPAQVATESYRANWEAVFGARKEVGIA